RRRSPSTLFPYTTLFRSYVTSKIEEYRIELEKLQPTTDASRTKIAMLKSQLEEFEKKKIEIEIELVQKKDDLKSILDNRLNAFKDRKSTRLNSSHVKSSY